MRKILLLILVLCLTVSPCVADEIDVFWLVDRGTPAQLKEALDKGAKFNVKRSISDFDNLDDMDVNGWLCEYNETPLHRAAAYNKNPEVIKFLIEQGLDVNAEGYMGHSVITPLSCAVEKKNVEAIKELLKAGANSSVYISSRTPTPLHFIAVQYKNSPDDVKSMIEAIKNASGDVNVHTELSKEDIASLTEYEEEFAKYKTIFLPRNQWKSDDPIGNVRDFSNAATGNLLATLTPLMYAVLYDNTDVVNILLDVSADANIKSAEGKTALDYANELPDSSALKKSPAFERLKASTTIKTEVKSANTIMPDTLPEASIELAKLYVTYDYDRDFFVDMQKLQYKERPSSFGDIIKEISNFQNRNTYTEEQVKYKIGRMIDNGQFPANYILAKGQYKYDSNINAVYPTTNLNLRSQPNTKARIITELYGGEVQVEGYIAHNAATYLGEWTSPQGDKWTAVEYLDNLHDDKKKLGWVSSKYVRLITNEQIREIINVINNEVMSDGGFAVKQYALAIAYDRNGEHDKARECIEKYIEDHPEITPYEVARQLYSEGMYQVAYDLIRKNLNTFDSKFLFAEIWTYHQNDIKIQDDDPITVGVFIGENIRRDKRVVDLDYAKREMRTAKDYYNKAFTYYACNNYTGPEFVDNLRIAAEMGYADAQYYWAEILAEGLHGVRQDETAAYNYFKKAAAQGHQDAKAILSLYQLLYRRY